MNEEEIKKLIEETSIRDREYIKKFVEENSSKRENLEEIININNLKTEKNIVEKQLSFILKFMGIVGAVIGFLGVLLPVALTFLNTQSKNAEFTQMKSDNKEIIDDIKKDFADMKNEVNNSKEKNENQREQVATKIDNKFSQYENKLDIKLKDFDNKFDEITNRAYLKPKLICLYHGKDLSGQVINYHKNNEPYLGIIIKNIGDAAAFDMKIGLYYDKESTNTVTNNVEIKTNDPIYKYMQTYDYKKVFNAKEDGIISLFVENDQYKEVLCKLRIYYGQPEPLEYYFTVQTKE